MAITKCNGLVWDNVVKIDNIPVANILKMNNLEAPAAGASRWVALAEDGFVGYCSNSDRTSWTGYDNDSGTSDAIDIAFGKDQNGNGIYCGTRHSGNREIVVSGTDVTSVGNWTEVDLPGGTIKQMCINWGARSNGAIAGTWMSAGMQGQEGIYRSIDGAQNWSKVDLSGITNHASNKFINGIHSDGNGNWMTLQGESGGRIYYSNDDGASFNASTPFTIGRGQAVAYTNNTWIVIYSRQSAIRIRTCAASDITTWSSEVNAKGIPHLSQDGQKISIAAANGNVCIVGQNDSDVNTFTVNGTTVSEPVQRSLQMSGDTIQDIATDGETWLIAAKDGDVWESTNNGASWTQIVNGFQADGQNEKDLVGICAAVVLPL